jgi:hypothetical protein
MENVVIFYDHLEFVTAIWYNLWPFSKVCGHLVYFSVLVCLDQEKSGNPDRRQQHKNRRPEMMGCDFQVNPPEHAKAMEI